MTFALNHTVAPQLHHQAFFKLAADLNLHQVEIRNDLPGVAVLDGTPASQVRSAAEQHALRILTINALQRFNDWTDTRASEAHELSSYARAVGAAAILMCPVNDKSFRPSDSKRLAGLRTALKELKPILEEAGLKGFIEPLGFPECSLRLKAEAADAIDETGAAETYLLVHDTFHHYVANETHTFPERTGIVHVSGVTDNTTDRNALRDPHRLLLDEHDRLGNVSQIRTLIAHGYTGPISLEPFASEVHNSPSLVDDLRRTLHYLRTAIDTSSSIRP